MAILRVCRTGDRAVNHMLNLHATSRSSGKSRMLCAGDCGTCPVQGRCTAELSAHV